MTNMTNNHCHKIGCNVWALHWHIGIVTSDLGPFSKCLGHEHFNCEYLVNSNR